MFEKVENNSIYIYGKTFPNRIFVGNLCETLEAKDLADFFEDFGIVVEAKILLTVNGQSKGYGFVTFMSKQDVENVMKQGHIYIRGRKVNLGPAVKKETPDMEGEPVVLLKK